MKKDLPIFYLEIDEDKKESGLDAVSFVDSPAIEMNWFTFKKDESYTFKKDDVKRVITSPVMLAEKEIFRVAPDGTEYLVKFSEDTIFNMMKKYFNDNKIHNVNENHNGDAIVDNVIMIESFVVGDRVTSELYPNLPKGSWVASFHIQDETYWNKVIMSDDFTGVSLEGQFDLVEAKFNEQVKVVDDEEKLLDEITELLKSDIGEDAIYEIIKNKLGGNNNPNGTEK